MNRCRGGSKHHCRRRASLQRMGGTCACAPHGCARRRPTGLISPWIEAGPTRLAARPSSYQTKMLRNGKKQNRATIRGRTTIIPRPQPATRPPTLSSPSMRIWSRRFSGRSRIATANSPLCYSADRSPSRPMLRAQIRLSAFPAQGSGDGLGTRLGGGYRADAASVDTRGRSRLAGPFGHAGCARAPSGLRLGSGSPTDLPAPSRGVEGCYIWACGAHEKPATCALQKSATQRSVGRDGIW